MLSDISVIASRKFPRAYLVYCESQV